MSRRQSIALGLMVAFLAALPARAEEPASVSERARKIHESGLLIDGHNDLPWELRTSRDSSLSRTNLATRRTEGHTDIPRLREGGVKAQFWSVYIPSNQPEPAKTVFEQIDLVHRMVEKYPEDLALALTATDIESIVKDGKIACLIGMEGGVAIENNLALLRTFYRDGARYLTLTHNETLDWADAATGDQKHGGLTQFGERVVKEMNRLGMLVDISHVSAQTMDDVLRVSQAPVIASHSSAFAICPSPRNVPDDILKRMPANGGVIMVNFYSGFIHPTASLKVNAARAEFKAKYPDDPEAYRQAMSDWYKQNPTPRATLEQVADHVDHLVKIAGVDHVGIGSDYDGIDSTPIGLEDASCFPRLTEELLRRGYSEADLHKILGANVLRAFREAEQVAARLRASTSPEVDEPAR